MARAAPPTSTASRPSSRSCSRSSARATATSAARTPSSSRWSAASTDDLNLPVEVVGCPLVRDADGLALSSRNAYLDPARTPRRAGARAGAAATPPTRSEPANGTRSSSATGPEATIDAEPAVHLDYAELVDARTVESVTRVESATVLAVAATVGRTRLLDNLAITTTGSGLEPDLGVIAEEQPA